MDPRFRGHDGFVGSNGSELRSPMLCTMEVITRSRYEACSPACGRPGADALESRIDRFALQGQYAEDPFVHHVELFAADESLQGLYAEDELPEGEGSLGS